MIERMAPPKEAKTWDRVIMSTLRLVELPRYILAGFDTRYGWTEGFPINAQRIALLVCLLSTAVFLWAMASNPFFSQVVRIQSVRGHSVAIDGPYHYVRHPGYISTIIFELAISTLLASWWGIIAGSLCAILFILRTGFEDRTLQAELSGYPNYAKQARFRLVPGIW